MVRKLVNWILCFLHIRKKTEPKPAIDILQDLLPVVCTTVILMGIVKWIGIGSFSPSLWRRLVRRFKYRIHYWRVVLVGY